MGIEINKELDIASVGDPYSFQLVIGGMSATKGEKPVYTYNGGAALTLPPGFFLDQYGVLNGVAPADYARSDVSMTFGIFKVTDGSGNTLDKTTTVTIPVQQITPIEIVYTEMSNPVEGAGYNFNLRANGGPGSFHWAWYRSQGDLPSGLKFNDIDIYYHEDNVPPDVANGKKTTSEITIKETGDEAYKATLVWEDRKTISTVIVCKSQSYISGQVSTDVDSRKTYSINIDCLPVFTGRPVQLPAQSISYQFSVDKVVSDDYDTSSIWIAMIAESVTVLSVIAGAMLWVWNQKRGKPVEVKIVDGKQAGDVINSQIRAVNTSEYLMQDMFDTPSSGQSTASGESTPVPSDQETIKNLKSIAKTVMETTAASQDDNASGGGGNDANKDDSVDGTEIELEESVKLEIDAAEKNIDSVMAKQDTEDHDDEDDDEETKLLIKETAEQLDNRLDAVKMNATSEEKAKREKIAEAETEDARGVNGDNA